MTTAIVVLRLPYPLLTDCPDLRAQVQGWAGITVALDDAAYVPLRTQWIPPTNRQTPAGAAILLLQKWPAEVQQAIDARAVGAIAVSRMRDLWQLITECEVDTPAPGEGSRDIASDGLSPTPGVNRDSIAQWSPGAIVTEIRRWIQFLGAPDEYPDPNDLSEDASRDLLVEILNLPAVVAESRRRSAESARETTKRRDARTIQYAIDVGVSLPDPTPPPMMQEFDNTDDGNGARMITQYRDSIRYCDHERAWYIWGGGRWERDETRRMLALAQRVARTIYIEASTATDIRRERVGKWAVASGMHARLKAMIECASPAVAVTPDDLDAHPGLWNCANGTLELDTGVFREARREDLLTKCCGVTYDPDATCQTWLAHLDLVFAGDRDYIDGFQELCGYAMLQENPEQIMAILYGVGKNGKSVTLAGLAHVWGDYTVNIAAESLMVKRGEGPRSDLARLRGARFVTAAEVEIGALLAENVVKQLTGDHAITVRRLYENEIEFTPGAKVFLATNHEPRIRGTDEGIWRRIWMLPFIITIPEEKRDVRILDRLEAEGAGILNWCLTGLRRYQENGCRLSPPESVVAATRRFRSESDVIGRFLADEMVADPMGTIERPVLYKIYVGWCEEEGERPVASRTLNKYLREKQIGERKSSGAWLWQGLRIKNRMEAEEDERAGSAQGML